MTYSRHMMAGMTDYTGVPLEDILTHLDDWIANTAHSLKAIAECRLQVQESPLLFENAGEVLSYIAHFTDLLTRYANDFRRLQTEMPTCVTDAHIETVSQLYVSAKSEEVFAVEFSRDWITHRLPHESVRPTLDRIYAETRDQCIDMKDLSNLVPRLRALRSERPPAEALTDLHLKPNLFGIGVNVNRLLGRLRGRWRARKARA